MNEVVETASFILFAHNELVNNAVSTPHHLLVSLPTNYL